MIFRAIVSAVLRKASAFLKEVQGLAERAKQDAYRIEQAAKAEIKKIEAELVSKIAAL